MEMFWAPSVSQGLNAGVFTGLMSGGYGPPGGLDMAEWSSDDPIMVRDQGSPGLAMCSSPLYVVDALLRGVSRTTRLSRSITLAPSSITS